MKFDWRQLGGWPRGIVPRGLALRSALAPLCLLLWVGSLTALEPPLPPELSAQNQRSPEAWAQILRENAAEATSSRRLVWEAMRQRQNGQLDAAARTLDAATELDASDPQPHLERVRIDLKRLDPTGIGELVVGMQLRWTGALRQAREIATLLIWIDLVLAAFFVWLLLHLTLRYLPFWKHQLSARQDERMHAKRAHRLLWIPVLLFPLICLGFGLVPFICVLSVSVYVYAHRRARTAIALLLLWFGLQGVYGLPFGAPLSALDPESRISLMVAATNDAPTSGLIARVERARATRPDDPMLRFAAGMVQARAGQLQESSGHFLAALSKQANDPLAMTNLANNHFYLGDIDRAVAGYQRAAQLAPDLGVIHHNLSQAYLRKLFMREGSEAMEQAMRLGFVPSRNKRALPRGAVYYTSPSDRALWTLAWQDRAGLLPSDLLGAAGLPLGVPAHHAGWWLVASLLVGWIGQRVRPRSQLVFECANCERLSCRHCCGEHDGLVLCLGCAQTAKRARSELVLATLLRNRRHEAELVAQRRLRWWNAWFFGGAHLQNLQRRGVNAAWILCLGFWLVVAPSLPADPWTMSMRESAPIGRWIGSGLLALLWIFCWLGRVPLRTPPLHVHPGSLVSLGDLIEGRPRRRASA